MAYERGLRPSFRGIIRDLNSLITSGARWAGRGGQGWPVTRGPRGEGHGCTQSLPLAPGKVGAVGDCDGQHEPDSCCDKRAPQLQVEHDGCLVLI